MSAFKNVQKFFDGRVLLLIGIIVVVAALGNYSMRKGSLNDFMTNPNTTRYNTTRGRGGLVAANPEGDNSGPASVQGIHTTRPIGPSCAQQPMQDPASLLPKDANSEWARLNPHGAGKLENINLLKSGYHIGIDTVGSSLRNANLQVRSEPPNPQVNVGPWQHSSIEPDLMRRPLEIDCGPQHCDR